MNKWSFSEFFAGGGMARAGLGSRWKCEFANDFDKMKARTYKANWGDEDLKLADINSLSLDDLPGYVDLAWASFPCQDLSLAGNAAGLGCEHAQTRSGAFWAFWRLMSGLIDSGIGPAMIVLENVYGSLTANGGRDFATICRCLSLGGYRFGSILIDASRFVPQSRPRIFIVGIRKDISVPTSLIASGPQTAFHPMAMCAAIERLAEPDREQWLWLNPPLPLAAVPHLETVIDEHPLGVSWHEPEQTVRLLAMMSAPSRKKLEKMQIVGKRMVGTIYRRTRIEDGIRRQRAELRDDGIAGCLRTPGGGSSRQIIIVVNGDEVRTRLLSAREAARLMGLPESYILPERYNDAYHVSGDGVVVPVVKYLAETLLEPVAKANRLSELLVAAE